MLLPFKIIFCGTLHHEMYKIEAINGDWINKQYTFQHPAQFQGEPQGQTHKVQPIGLWQRLIIVLFVIGMLGSAVSTIYGIQQMQPYIVR